MTVVLCGLGACLPPGVLTNADLSSRLDTSDKWITTRTGIRERRVVTDGLSTLDLAVEAAGRALESAAAGANPGADAVDAVVLATTSPERICPAGAPELAARLGLGTLPAYDITSACSGFVYGLATAAGLIEAGVAESVLLVGAEAFTTFVDPDDRGTAPIFGDGGGAVVLRRGAAGEPGEVGPFDLGSDGARADLLAIPSGGARQRSRDGSLGHGAGDGHDWYLAMEGRPLFQQAVDRMSSSARAVLARTGLSVDDVDHFVGHQANARILTTVADELDLPRDRMPMNIDHVGNTLTASIPLLLAELAAEGSLAEGDRVLVGAFGAGLSWGSVMVTWPDLKVQAP